MMKIELPENLFPITLEIQLNTYVQEVCVKFSTGAGAVLEIKATTRRTPLISMNNPQKPLTEAV